MRRLGARAILPMRSWLVVGGTVAATAWLAACAGTSPVLTPVGAGSSLGHESASVRCQTTLQPLPTAAQTRTASAAAPAKAANSEEKPSTSAGQDACTGEPSNVRLVNANVSPTGAVHTGPVARDVETIVEFESDNAPVSERDRKLLAAALEINTKAGFNKVRLYAGRGGNGNFFERAAIAERRARLVKQLVPPRMVVSVEFDPLQADDTVRVEFVSAP